MTSAGEVRSPLEASVQRLCNTRPVEVMCTWTNTSLQFPRANAIYGLLRTGRRSAFIHLPPIWRPQPTSSCQGVRVIPTNPSLARMTCAMGLQLSSIAATRRRSAGDFSLPCAQWESRWLNSPPRRQSLLSCEQSRDGAPCNARRFRGSSQTWLVDQGRQHGLV
jgi:hypothetical protein